MIRMGGAASLTLAALLVVSAASKAAEPVKIGIPVGLSGANSVVAPSVVQAAQLAAAEINAKGGILGRPVDLEIADDRSGADGAVAAYNSLIFQKKVNAIITMETSAARNAGLPVVAEGQNPVHLHVVLRGAGPAVPTSMSTPGCRTSRSPPSSTTS